MDKRNLYTASQLARACSVSRATILRLEADGLLIPVARDGSAEYRYYDCTSIMHVLQILSLQKMGFTRKEIHEYFRVPGDFSNCLSVLQNRMVQLEQMVQKMQLRVDLSNHMKIERIHIPDTVCYAKPKQFDCLYFPIGSSTPPGDRHYHSYNYATQVAFKEAVDHGLTVDCSGDFFSLVDCPALLKEKQPEHPFECSSCIPLLDEKGTPHTTTLPACDCIAITWYHGQPETRHQAYMALAEAIREQGLTPAGPLRVIGIIHQYMGTDISVNRNVIRIAQPIQT